MSDQQASRRLLRAPDDLIIGGMNRFVLVLLTVLTAAAPLCAQAGRKSPTASVPPLVPGVAMESSVEIHGSDVAATRFTLAVPESAFAVEIAVSNSPADLDLVVYGPHGGLVAVSEYADYNESVMLTRVGEPELVTGLHEIEVIYQLRQAPVVDGRTLTSIPFALSARLVTVDAAITLRPGELTPGRLEPRDAMMRLYRVEVPRGAAALRVDIADTDGDLDLFVNRRFAPGDPYDYSHSAQTIRSTETLTIAADSVPRVSFGTYYIMVVDQVSFDAPVDYSIIVSLTADPPEAIRGIPVVPIPADPFERALAATVEVSTPDGGGSGCIVTASGYILTNWHVVAGPDDRPSEDIVIGISLDHTRPPVELFHAEVVAWEPERDLALLRITAGRYGDRLPAGYAFPALERSTDPVRISGPVHFIGYPWVGGTGSRASITYTRGVVAGFQRTGFGLVFKSDGEINPGNSGGAALDDRFRLIGLPTSIVGRDSGQLAYVVPITAVPEPWLSMIGW